MTSEETEMTFDQWCDKLDALAAAEGCETPYTRQTGRECWRERYDDGDAPEDAWPDEKSYAAEDHDSHAG